MILQRQKDRQYRQLKSQKTGEEYSLSHVISESIGAKDIFVSSEIILPEMRSSAPHFHEETDELIYVLKGQVTAIEGDSEVVVNEGDAFVFEKNSGQSHFLKNNSQAEAHVLVIRKNIKSSDVVFGA